MLATNSEGDAHLIQAYFKPTMATISGDELRWLGYLQSLWVDPWGNLREDSNQNGRMDLVNEDDTMVAAEADQIIVYTTESNGDTKVRRYTKHYMYHPKNGLHGDCYLDRLSPPIACEAPEAETIDIDKIIPIFEAGDMLRQRDADTRKIFTFLDGEGDDDDADGLIDESGEDEGAGLKIVGQVLAPFSDNPYDDLNEVVVFTKTTWPN